MAPRETGKNFGVKKKGIMVCSGIFWSGQLLEMITVIVKISAEPSQLKLEEYATSYALWVKTGNYGSMNHLLCKCITISI